MSVTADFSVMVKAMAANETCATCKFIAVLPGSGQKICRRFPPTVPAYAVPPGNVPAVWPPVGDDDTCGEFQPATTLDKLRRLG